jgi:type II secretory ATPase GspE/PulE/Tfp pilus assembly ATPase PilB-like protein
MLTPLQVGNTVVGMRFQTIIGVQGPKIIIRLYDANQTAIPLDQLGYSDSQIELLVEAGMKEKGLVLFCGVTGSGKTVAQKTFIETHPSNGVGAIYSLEDPIELPLEGVHQIPFQRDLADPEASSREFNLHVSSIVRADLDGVLIGEIRDAASAAAAMQFQSTGHFVVSTLHANKLSGVARRLTEEKSWGLTRAEITGPEVLNLMIYQGLVPRLCPKCKISGTETEAHKDVAVRKRAKKVDPAKEISATLDILSRNFGLSADRFYFRRAGGCPHCKGRGTRGRTSVAEMFMPDETWLQLTSVGDDIGAHKHYRSFSDGDIESPDMTGKTILEHTLYKAALGIVDPRECRQFDGFEKQFK